jgi:alkyldihydroxyacetonephosphate synthase
MHRHRQAVIPFGAGSGVLGGGVPLSPDVVTIDLKRLNKVLAIDDVSKLATVQAGMNGERFEAHLNNLRYTAGHLPQSLSMSTVGGWASCRGAGQASGRYGKIEDIVVGLKVALPDGELLTIRPAPRRAVGPNLQELFLGAEGTFGIIVELTLRIWDYPAKEEFYGYGFPDYVSGLDALRRIMQSGMRLPVTRLYDAPESASRIANYPDYKDMPCLGMLGFAGDQDFVELEKKKALEIVTSCGGKKCSDEPVHTWVKGRFFSLTAEKNAKGMLMDTLEVSAHWSIMPDVYEAMREAALSVDPSAHVGAHWSHSYTDGACLYVTFGVDGSDEEAASSKQDRMWDKITKACHEKGGCMSHHHGVGFMRGKWMDEEWGQNGLALLQGIKNLIDPHHIMNPGKIGLK